MTSLLVTLCNGLRSCLMHAQLLQLLHEISAFRIIFGRLHQYEPQSSNCSLAGAPEAQHVSSDSITLQPTSSVTFPDLPIVHLFKLKPCWIQRLLANLVLSNLSSPRSESLTSSTHLSCNIVSNRLTHCDEITTCLSNRLPDNTSIRIKQ